MDLSETSGFVSLGPGVLGSYKGRTVEVLSLPEADKILIFDPESHTSELIPVHEFTLERPAVAKKISVHDRVKEWDHADRRFAIIEPLVMRKENEPRATIAEVKEQAAVAGVHFTTIYRWKRSYENSGRRPRGLMPKTKQRGSKQTKLDPVTNSLVERVINDVYLDKQQPTIKATHRELKLLCDSAGIPLPHYNTLRRRIKAIPEPLKLKRRSRAKQAREIFEPRPGSLEVDRPWQLVQIDHTPTDVILVDEAHRRSIGRAFVTVAIDVYSRMVLGLYVSLERPDAQIAGLCLTNAMLPKAPLLAQLGSEIDWPCFGKPVTVHVDNAMEFHGATLFRACQDNAIEQEFRPLKTPEYGGHIEAFMKTLMRKVHELKGSTFFSVEHRAEYDSEKMADKDGLTIREFEKWLLEAVHEYHESYHSGILESPKTRYRAAFGPRTDGLPIQRATVVADPERLRIDFMPSETRTIGKKGVRFWNIYYYHSVMRRLEVASENWTER